MNNKRTSKEVATLASRTLRNENASAIQRSLAAGALSQRAASKQTSATMEDIASKVLSSDKYSETTKTLAASILSQSNKDR